MRTAIKVFLIIGLALNAVFLLSQSITCFIGLFTHSLRNAILIIKLILTIVAGIGLVLCPITLSCLDTYKTGLSVGILLFGNVIAGLLMLIYKDDARRKDIEKGNELFGIRNEEIRAKNAQVDHNDEYFENLQMPVRQGLPVVKKKIDE